jgi:predicted transcriptional regulator YdeE
LVNALARHNGSLPSRLTLFGIFVGIGQLVMYIGSFLVGGYDEIFQSGFTAIMEKIPFLISLVIGIPLAFLGAPVWLVWLGQALLRTQNTTPALSNPAATMTIINGLKIIGIAVRTTNKDGQSAQDIGKLWEQFYAAGLLETIPNKVSNDIYAIYTDYQSDYRDEYKTILGAQVNSLDRIPSGMIGREFPAETFEVFPAKGGMPKAVMDTWSDIWQRDQELQRKYTYDFEHYTERSQAGENSEVSIFIATHK